MMNRFTKATLIVVATAMIGGASWGATPFEESHKALVAKNPPGLSVTLEVPVNFFYVGERIPLTLFFRNGSDLKYSVWAGTYDRSGRIDDIHFYVEGPEGGFVDPLKDYFDSGLRIGGGLGNSVPLGEYRQTFDLNEWVRFDRPGEYRVYCDTTRVHGWHTPPTEIKLCSQIITLQIQMPKEEWMAGRATLAEFGLKVGNEEIRRAAARSLRFLASRDAIDRLIPLLADDDLSFEAVLGIAGARDPAHARQALTAKLSEPDTIVNGHYVHVLIFLSVPREKYARPQNLVEPRASQKWWDELFVAQAAARKNILRQLAAALPQKRGRALAEACSALIQGGEKDADLRAKLAGSFSDLPPREQTDLLDYRWNDVKCGAFEPVLQRISAVTPRGGDWPAVYLQSFAILRYAEFQPEKVRKMILDDIRRPRPKLQVKVLFSLKDDALPEMDDVFQANLQLDEADLDTLVPLIERYATNRILPAFVARYRQNEGKWACRVQAAFLRYWMKYDPPNGLAAVGRAMQLREHTRCFASTLGQVLSKYYTPAAETLAISFLDDAEPDVAADAASLLGSKGSPAAVDALLVRLSKSNPWDTAVSRGSIDSESAVYWTIVNTLLEVRREALSKEQKVKLADLLKDDSSKARFRERFKAK